MQIIIFIFSILNFNVSAQGTAAPIDFVMDMNNVMIRSNGTLTPGAAEYIESLLMVPGARVHFYSNGGAPMTERVLSNIILSDGRTAFEIATDIITSDFDIRNWHNNERVQQPNKEVVRNRFRLPGGGKDLTRLNVDVDLERAVLVDDTKRNAVAGQEMNLLWVKHVHESPSFEELRWLREIERVPSWRERSAGPPFGEEGIRPSNLNWLERVLAFLFDANGKSSRVRGSARALDLDLTYDRAKSLDRAGASDKLDSVTNPDNRMIVARGVIDLALERSKFENISFRQALFDVQWEMKSPEGPISYRVGHSAQQDSILLSRGLQRLREVNPEFMPRLTRGGLSSVRNRASLSKGMCFRLFLR